MEYRPVQDKLIVKLVAGQEEIRTTILIPDSARKGRREAVVVAIGPGQATPKGVMPIRDISVGDVVLLNPNCGMMLDREEGIKVVRYDDILGVANVAPAQ